LEAELMLVIFMIFQMMCTGFILLDWAQKQGLVFMELMKK